MKTFQRHLHNGTNPQSVIYVRGTAKLVFPRIFVCPPGLPWGLSGSFRSLSGDCGVWASLGLWALGLVIIYNSFGLKQQFWAKAA